MICMHCEMPIFRKDIPTAPNIVWHRRLVLPKWGGGSYPRDSWECFERYSQYNREHGVDYHGGLVTDETGALVWLLHEPKYPEFSLPLVREQLENILSRTVA